MYQLPDVLIKQMILNEEGDTNSFPAGYVFRLYTAGPTPPNKQNVIGDFTELTNAQVPGYVPVAGAWLGAPIRKADGDWEDQGAAPLPFGATGAPPVPITVLGWYATDAAKTTLIGSGSFLAPFTFTLSGDGFSGEQVIRAREVDGTNYELELDFEIE